jgi:hypothetical protein
MNTPKPGSTNARRGMLVAMAGLLLPLGSRWLLDGIGGVWLYSVSILGVILLLVGIGQRARHEMLPPAKKARRQVEASRAGLLRTMDAVKKERKKRNP